MGRERTVPTHEYERIFQVHIDRVWYIQCVSLDLGGMSHSRCRREEEVATQLRVRTLPDHHDRARSPVIFYHMFRAGDMRKQRVGWQNIEAAGRRRRPGWRVASISFLPFSTSSAHQFLKHPIVSCGSCSGWPFIPTRSFIDHWQACDDCGYLVSQPQPQSAAYAVSNKR
jgi:hypothetical protein